MISLSEFTAADIAGRSGASVEMVRKLIQRRGERFQVLGRRESGQAGNPPLVYRLNQAGEAWAKQAAQAFLDEAGLPPIRKLDGVPLGLAAAEKTLLAVFPAADWDERGDVLRVAASNLALAEKQLADQSGPASADFSMQLAALCGLRHDLDELIRRDAEIAAVAGLDPTHQAVAGRLRAGLAGVLSGDAASADARAATRDARAAIGAACDLGAESKIVGVLKRVLGHQLWRNRVLGAAATEAAMAAIEEVTDPGRRLKRMVEICDLVTSQVPTTLGRASGGPPLPLPLPLPASAKPPSARERDPSRLPPAGAAAPSLVTRALSVRVTDELETSVVLVAGDSSVGSTATSLLEIAIEGSRTSVPVVLVDASFDGVLNKRALEMDRVYYHGGAAALAGAAVRGLASAVSEQIAVCAARWHGLPLLGLDPARVGTPPNPGTRLFGGAAGAILGRFGDQPS